MSENILLSTESTCDLGDELIEKFHVHVMPYHVELDGQMHTDGVDITADDIYRAYEEKKILPRTAAINISEYTDYFKQFVDKGYTVIHITLGHALSSAYQNAVLAAEDVGSVYIIDSCNLSTGIGLLVCEAADRIAAGMPAAQIVEEITALRSHVSAGFVLDTLEFLYKGGRCSALAMLGANLLKLKPCIAVNPESGAMDVVKKYRGPLDKVLAEYVGDQLNGRTDLRLKRVFVTHSGMEPSRVDAVVDLVKKTASFEEVYTTVAGCTICSHCGPNTLGVLFITE